MYFPGESLTFAACRITGLAGMVSKQIHCEVVAGLLELVDDSVIEGILVLFQPAREIVGHSTGIVNNGKVGFLLAWFSWLGLDEVWRFSQMVGLQLFLKGLVSSFWKH